MLALAAGGFWILVRRSPRRAALLGVMFSPYAVFHLVFQETVTVRYALPLVLPVAYLAAVAVMAARPCRGRVRDGRHRGCLLWLAVPAGVAYARNASPIEAALSGMRGTLPAGVGDRYPSPHLDRIAACAPLARGAAGTPAAGSARLRMAQLTQAWRERDADRYVVPG